MPPTTADEGTLSQLPMLYNSEFCRTQPRPIYRSIFSFYFSSGEGQPRRCPDVRGLNKTVMGVVKSFLRVVRVLLRYPSGYVRGVCVCVFDRIEWGYNLTQVGWSWCCIRVEKFRESNWMRLQPRLDINLYKVTWFSWRFMLLCSKLDLVKNFVLGCCTRWNLNRVGLQLHSTI